MVLIRQFKSNHLIDIKNKKISNIIKELPKTFQSPTMAPIVKMKINIRLLIK